MIDGHARVSVSDAILEVITPCKNGTQVSLFIRPEEVSIAVKRRGFAKNQYTEPAAGNDHKDGAVWTLCPDND